MKRPLSPLAKVLIAAFLFASSLACGPFSHFLQNGGSGIITRISQSQMSVTYAELFAKNWEAILVYESGSCSISLRWDDDLMGEHFNIEKGTVVEDSGVSETGYYRFRSCNGQYCVSFSIRNEDRSVASIFMEDLMAQGDPLSYSLRLRTYMATANYVEPISFQEFIGEGVALFRKNEGWHILALPYHLYKAIAHYLLRWQLPVLAAFPESSLGAFLWVWRAVLAMPLMVKLTVVILMFFKRNAYATQEGGKV